MYKRSISKDMISGPMNPEHLVHIDGTGLGETPLSTLLNASVTPRVLPPSHLIQASSSNALTDAKPQLKKLISTPENFDHRLHAETIEQAEQMLSTMVFEALKTTECNPKSVVSAGKSDAVDTPETKSSRRAGAIDKAMISAPIGFDHIAHADTGEDIAAIAQNAPQNQYAQAQSAEPTFLSPKRSMTMQRTKSQKTDDSSNVRTYQKSFITNALSRATTMKKPRLQIGLPTLVMSSSSQIEPTANLSPSTAITPSSAVKSIPGLIDVGGFNAEGNPRHPPDLAEHPHYTFLSTTKTQAAPTSSTLKSKTFILDQLKNTKWEGLLNMGPSARTLRRVDLDTQLRITESQTERRKLHEAYLIHESQTLRHQREKITITDFEVLKTLGHGGFGVVRLVRDKTTREIFAMKVLRKCEMIKMKQESHVRAERDLLGCASEVAEWIVRLVYTFQDPDYLYFVLEFMPGGDLLGLLIKLDIFNEDFAKHYCAEMVMAIEEVHKLGMIHRDVKPDNFLFNSQGHLRLADFGLATDFYSWRQRNSLFDDQVSNVTTTNISDTREPSAAENKNTAASKPIPIGMQMGQKFSKSESMLNEKVVDGTATTVTEKVVTNIAEASPVNVIPAQPPHQVLSKSAKTSMRKFAAFSIVGTNNYIAPEVLRSNSSQGYDKSCDWWSLGVILFEMLFGFPPFCSKTQSQTKTKILNWRQSLVFPDQPVVSENAKDLIRRLICDAGNRFGSKPIVFGSSGADVLGTPTKGNRTLSSDAFVNRILGEGDAEDIKAHPWFSGTDWEQLHAITPPFVPDLQENTDTSYFEQVDEDEIQRMLQVNSSTKDNEKTADMIDAEKRLAFVGFTYRAPKAHSKTVKVAQPSKLGDAQAFNGFKIIDKEDSDSIDSL
ncbi:hypothetical protein BDV3_000833 [Batrachochytrium dendrobatidis]|uniref:non-specific serine/threonine protein kinase n=2 Tax=Batrachochytrium dendrobatidis (strain JEL423) TaxID=403673 RepID=A0A177W8W2_BATDL|nr:hypothetical protein BDEG_20384 [Batrachochytrium dendrobatidis JEL423]